MNVNFNLEVQPIDLTGISDLKSRKPTECDELLSSSPIVRFTIPNKKLSKPLTVTVPLPINPVRPKRPTTAISLESRNPATEAAAPLARPKSAFTRQGKDDEAEEEIQLLYKDRKAGWTKIAGIAFTLISKTKDIACFEMAEPYEKFVVFRTKPGVKDMRLEKIARLLEESLVHRNVQIILKQRSLDASDVAVCCTNSGRVDRALKHLADDGYDEGPPQGKDLVLRDGQAFEIQFRGNVQCVSEDVNLKFVYNTHIRCRRDFVVEELDKFAQKGLHCYRGFAQIFAISPSSPDASMDKRRLLTELLITIPKPEPEPPKPLKTAPLKITQEGPLTPSVLHHLANELGPEWKKLAQCLNLKPMRIQAILRQNVNNENAQTRYDMLVTWVKRIPKSVDKVAILSHALLTCGRGDLADELRDRDEDVRQQRIQSARLPHLRQAFVKVARTVDVVKKWQRFAKRLGLSEEEIRNIEESGGSGQQKVYTSLETWKDKTGNEASVDVLASKLQHERLDKVTRELEPLMTHS